MWRLLVSIVGPADAEDCFQETFIAALRAYPRLRPDSNLRSWVLTIAHRKALDVHRARARRALPVADVDALDGRISAAASAAAPSARRCRAPRRGVIHSQDPSRVQAAATATNGVTGSQLWLLALVLHKA